MTGLRSARSSISGKMTISISHNKCWELPQNAKNRPTKWVSKKTTESANVAADVDTGPMVELLLSNIDDEPHTFSLQQHMLLQPGIDTAATVHMSPHQEGMVNMKNTRGEITVGNGEVMVAKKTGDIPCDIMNKYGNPLKTCVIKDFALTKSSPFNLFSLTKMMKQRWTLGGDQETGITLSKGDQKLSFDIPIETPKGVVYAIYLRRSEVAAPALPATMSIKNAPSAGTSVGRCYTKDCKVSGMDNYKRVHVSLSAVHNRQSKAEKYSEVEQARNMFQSG
jgi:hypothetical protein